MPMKEYSTGTLPLDGSMIYLGHLLGVCIYIYIYIYSHPQTDLFRSIRTHQLWLDSSYP